jgi:hypothetical protein
MSKPQDMLLADGFADALIGHAVVDGHYRAVYAAERIIQILCQRDNMDYFDAYEYYQFNIECAHLGPNTPIFLRTEPIEGFFIDADE